MCKYCCVKIAGFHLRSWMIVFAVLVAVYALGSLIYFLVMVIEDLGRLGKGDYLFQMMPNRKLVRNYLYRGQLHSLRRLCIVDFQNDIDHTYDGAPPVDDPFDDDNDTTNAALGSSNLYGRSMDAIPPGVDEDWAVEYLFRGRKSRKDKRLMLQKMESNAASYRLMRYRRQTGEAPIDERLAPNPSNPSPEKGKKYVTGRQGPPQSGTKPGAKPRAKRGAKPSAKLGRDPDPEPEPQSEPQSEPQHEVEKPFGAACLKAASSKMGPIKKMFKEKFDTFCNRSEKRFSIVIIVVDFIMLILNIMLVVTCYCFIVSVRRKEVNLAIGFVVLAAVCLCINPCYWVVRLAMTPPWGYFNGVRIALTVIFLLLFWGVFFFAIVMAAKFFYFCFLVELDSTSPLVQQSDVDQRTMKRDIET